MIANRGKPTPPKRFAPAKSPIWKGWDAQANTHTVHSGGSIVKYNLYVTLGTDLTWYGTDGIFGSINLTTTIKNQPFNSLKWSADGNFIMQFGDLGNERVDGKKGITVKSETHGSVVLLWNNGTNRYEGVDLDMANSLISAQTGGETVELLSVLIGFYGWVDESDIVWINESDNVWVSQI